MFTESAPPATHREAPEHLRGCDYLEVMPHCWKGVVGDRAYLQQAIDWFWARHEAPIFVVTSNGMGWCQKNTDTSRGRVVFAGDGQEDAPSKDFALLVQCNRTIMTIGTFGFWAAWLVETLSTWPTSPCLTTNS